MGHKLAEIVYSTTNAQTAGAADAAGAQQQAGSADDVVDADYEVVDDNKKKSE